MEKWEILSETEREETPKFNRLVHREVFLTQFAAVIARNILEIANSYSVDETIVYREVGRWLEKLDAVGVENVAALKS